VFLAGPCVARNPGTTPPVSPPTQARRSSFQKQSDSSLNGHGCRFRRNARSHPCGSISVAIARRACAQPPVARAKGPAATLAGYSIGRGVRPRLRESRLTQAQRRGGRTRSSPAGQHLRGVTICARDDPQAVDVVDGPPWRRTSAPRPSPLTNRSGDTRGSRLGRPNLAVAAAASHRPTIIEQRANPAPPCLWRLASRIGCTSVGFCFLWVGRLSYLRRCRAVRSKSTDSRDADQGALGVHEMADDEAIW
jgi:hypothetical protein